MLLGEGDGVASSGGGVTGAYLGGMLKGGLLRLENLIKFLLNDFDLSDVYMYIFLSTS